MRKILRVLIALTLFFSTASLSAEESNRPVRTAQRGDGAGYSTKDATTLSMMGWGIGLALGIALLCGYLEHDTGQAH